jgi:hypothetical protein
MGQEALGQMVTGAEFLGLKVLGQVSKKFISILMHRE